MALYEINADATRGSGLFFRGRAGEAVVRGQVVGGELYASGTAGDMTQTIPAGAGDVVQVVGMATKTTQVQFNPRGGAPDTMSSNTLEGSTAFVGTDATKAGFVNYFVTDGVADNVQIDAAINYVDGLGGGSVELERGIFTLAATVTMDENDIELKGQGWDTYLSGAAVATAVTVSGSRCQVKDLRVATTGGATNNFDGISITGADCIVERVWVSDSDRHGILVNGPTARIQHNQIDSVDDNFVSIGALGDGSIVSNNDMDTSGDDGILIDADAENCHVSDNRIVSWTNEPVDDNSGTSTVENNWAGGTVLTSKGCSLATVALAITFQAGDGVITVPPGTWSEAVVLSDADTILQGMGWGTVIDGGTTGHAVEVTAANCVVRDIQVKTDTGQGNAFDGVSTSAGGTDALIDNVFVNGSDRYCIQLAGNNSRLINSRLFDADNEGIVVNAVAMIEGNRLLTAGAFGIFVGNVAGASDTVIDGNFIDGTGDDGIFVNANAEDLIIDSNRIANWTNECIDDDSGTSTVGDNECTV
jgi:hypothetical protein